MNRIYNKISTLATIAIIVITTQAAIAGGGDLMREPSSSPYIINSNLIDNRVTQQAVNVRGFCRCEAPADIRIVCEGDWYNDTNFDFATDQEVPGYFSSRVGRNEAWCSYDGNFQFETRLQSCPSRRTQSCDNYCESQFENEDFMEIRSFAVLNCVDYFQGQCSGQLLVDGSHDANDDLVTYQEFMGNDGNPAAMNEQTAREDYGVYDVYGICR